VDASEVAKPKQYVQLVFNITDISNSQHGKSLHEIEERGEKIKEAKERWHEERGK